MPHSGTRCSASRLRAGEREVVVDPGDAVLEAVVHVEDGGLTRVADALDEGEDELAVHVVEAQARFVENQQRRVFDHGASDQRQPLFAERQPGERFVGPPVHAEERQPVVGDGLLHIGAAG